ncbi:hypothetical protein Clacol_005738 [Clathrus columnatus]|uniref:Small ribosomal subunit protein uS10m n=1 Tax=Clathrus columnatus TaxID=1419009 RepID=A0AAV5AAY9_9AGAM|nr:hypothetical protein Clacol_005738 [Clathrus columnatus]
MITQAKHNQGTVWAADDFLPPIVYHPRPHGIPVALLHFRSHHPKLLELFTYFATHTASALDIPISRPVFLPNQRSLWTVPRSPFVHKKSQENFERIVHKRLIKAWDADPIVIGTWVNYLKEYHVEGVGLRIVRWEHAPIGFANANAEALRRQVEEMRRSTDRGRIEETIEKVVAIETEAARTEENKSILDSEHP